jgi:prevent-host-death family protein
MSELVPATTTDTLTRFKRDTTRFLKRLRRTKEPMVLTVNGKPELVVQDAVSYQELQERVERLETLAAVREGMQDVAAGRVRSAAEVLADLAHKHSIKPAKRK